MERRVILAFLLSFAVFLLFVRFFGPDSTAPDEAAVDPAPTPVTAPAPVGGVPATSPGADAAPSVAVAEDAAPAAPAAVVEAEREQLVVVRTPLYEARLTNRGGRLLSLRLEEHRDAAGGLFEAIPQGDESVLAIRPLDVVLPGDPAPERLQAALYRVEVDGRERGGPVERRVEAGETMELRFRWGGADGLQAVKSLRFSGDGYGIAGQVSVLRGGAEQRKEILYGPGVGEEVDAGRYLNPDQGVIKTAGESRLYSVSDVAEGAAASLSAQAVGVASHYFAGLLVGEPGQRYEARLDSVAIPWTSFTMVPEDAEGSRILLLGRLLATGEASFTLFSGPKQVEALGELGVEIVEFGDWLRVLVVPLRAGLMWAYGVTGNYGWAIVLVTILISLLLAPLKHYSYVSIRRMQKISPNIKRIQARYKGMKPTDPRRQGMNQEMMALYKEHNVSPVGGCLPMLAMIPFFFAFYRLLVVSVELRHAPFVFWVQDLSREDPYFILPILMGVSQLFMQRMTTTAVEGIQAKMMMFLPVVFTLILAWAPAGLVLYWFANNLVSMGQQVATSRILDRREAATEVIVPAGGKGKARHRRRKAGRPRR